MKDRWIRKEVVELTEIPDRRVLFYTEQNILPGFQKTVGRGTPRTYSIVDIFYLLLLKELNALGLSLTPIRAIILFLHMKAELWKSGTFTKEPVVLIISLNPKEHVLHPDAQGYNEEFDIQVVRGSKEIKLLADSTSKIVVNLNEIFAKTGG